MGLIKFAAKLGVVGGTIYYLSEEGVWKRSEESTKIYGNISEAVNPHIQDLKGQLPFKIPDLPPKGKMSYLFQQYWNEGVESTIKFMLNFPSYVSMWTQHGIEMASNHPEIQKLLGNQSSEGSENKEEIK